MCSPQIPRTVGASATLGSAASRVVLHTLQFHVHAILQKIPIPTRLCQALPQTAENQVAIKCTEHSMLS